MFRHLSLLILLLPCSLFSQRKCIVNNLWQNGNFESSSLICQKNNPKNTYWDQSSPWFGYTLMRWKPTYDLQPSYLDEADTDHTLGTSNGHYYYLDPRAKSGWDYEFQQDIQVEKNTDYTFSLWYCSMNKPGNPAAVIRLAVNNVAVTAQTTITNSANNWKLLSGTWNSGNNTTAIASLQTYNAGVSGHDFAIDDINFGTGILVAFAGNDSSFCANTKANLGLIDAAQYGVSCDKKYSYNWQPSANFVSANNIPQPELKTPIISGIYTLTVTDYNGNTCTDSVNIGLIISGKKALNIFNDTAVCAGDFVTQTVPNKYTVIQWNDGSKAATRTFTDTGLFWIEFTDGCGQFMDTFRINGLPAVNAFDFKDTLICEGQSVSYLIPSFNNLNSIAWFNGDTGISKTFDQEGIYWVTTNQTCGQHIDTFKIGFIKETIPDIVSNIELCYSKDTVILIPFTYKNIVWSDGDTSHIKNINKPGILILTFLGNCKNYYDTTLVKIILPNMFSLGNDDTVCFSQPIDISAPSGYNYLWNEGSNTRQITIKSPGVYSVVITDKFGCKSTDSIQFFTSSQSISLDIPNAFTPDGNGLNDLFPANVLPIDAKLQIFSRWGESLFDNEISPIWNGMHLNKPAPEGAYVYILTYRDCMNYPIVKKGTVHILR